MQKDIGWRIKMLNDQINGKVVRMVSDFLLKELYIYFEDGSYLKISSDSNLITEVIER